MNYLKHYLTRSLEFCLLLGFVSITQFTHSQQLELTKYTKDTLINSISQKIGDNYVFQDKAKVMQTELLRAAQAGTFDTIQNPQIFATSVQSLLRKFCDNDKHLRLMYFPASDDKVESDNQKSLIPLEREFEKRKKINFGIPEIKMLPGNIGYLKISKLTSPKLMGPVISASSEFLKHVDALVLDLRPRGGGSSYTMELLLSYFLPEATHIFTWDFRDPGALEQSWTLPYVDGKRFLDIPITVLTSKETFSGSEAVAYALKHHKRATIIGETTAGGAHTYKEFSLSKEYLFLVPYGRMVSTQTNANWEAVGVVPDIEISADGALERALMELSEKLK